MILNFECLDRPNTIFYDVFSCSAGGTLGIVIFVGLRSLGGLKLDEIDATNSFLMLLMARNGLKWPFKAIFMIMLIIIFFS